MQVEKNQIEKRSWQEFRDSKLLWWVNRSLHLFGWSIVLEMDKDRKITAAYPAKVTFRGFSQETESKNFIELTNYLRENINEINNIQ